MALSGLLGLALNATTNPDPNSLTTKSPYPKPYVNSTTISAAWSSQGAKAIFPRQAADEQGLIAIPVLFVPSTAEATFTAVIWQYDKSSNTWFKHSTNSSTNYTGETGNTILNIYTNQPIFIQLTTISAGTIDIYFDNGIASTGTLYSGGFNAVTPLSTFANLANQFTAASSQEFSIADNASLSLGNFDFMFCGFASFDAVNVQQCILGKCSSLTGGANLEFTIWLTSAGVLRSTISDGTTTTSTPTSGSFTLVANQAYFIEGIYDSVNNRVRINATPVGQALRSTSVGVAQSTGSFDSALAFNFGSSGSADYFGGRLWSWAFYNAYPAAAVIDSLYNLGAGQTYATLTPTQKTNLVAWWDFGETSGNLLDKGGSNNMTPSVSRPTSVFSMPDSITITVPATNQVIQRDFNGSTGNITIKGTYSGAPTNGLMASYNGGLAKNINATASGGIYTGTLTGQPVGPGGVLTVWFKDNPSVKATVTIGGVGILIVLAGQSNMSGRGTNNQVFVKGKAQAYLFGNDYQWKLLADPYDSSTGQIDTVSNDSAAGSYAILIANALSATNAIPIAFIPCAKGGSSIDDWQPGVDHQDRATLYGSMIYRAKLVGAEIVLFHLGETAAQNNVTQAAAYTGFANIATNVYNDTGLQTIFAKLQFCTALSAASQLNINQAIDQVWNNAALPYALPGPDLSGITTDSGDGLHMNADPLLQAAADLWKPKVKSPLSLA